MRVLDGSVEGAAKLSVADGVRAAISDAETKDKSPNIGDSTAMSRRQLLRSRRIGRSFRLMDSLEALVIVSDGLELMIDEGEDVFEISTISGRRSRVAQVPAS